MSKSWKNGVIVAAFEPAACAQEEARPATKHWTRTRLGAGLVFAAVFLIFGFAHGAKPAATPAYKLIDLLGFPDNGYQSQGQYITNRDSLGRSLILGNSRLYPDPQGPAVFHPALWNIAADGTFPATDPIDLGLPAFADGVQPSGVNRHGIAVGRTIGANEKDDDGDWVFPSYVDLGSAIVELPGDVNRNSDAWAINDAGAIVGTVEVADSNNPANPSDIKSVGALWQLNPDGTVDGPRKLEGFYPCDINNYGVMTGTQGGYPAIAWYEGATLKVLPMPPSPRFFGANVAALNDWPVGDSRLTVVGVSSRNEAGRHDAADSVRGVAWRPNDTARPTTVLGTLGGRESMAYDVNQRGEIVGWSDTSRSGQHAFVFKSDKMIDLNSQADMGTRTLQYALGINDSGDIVGFMRVPRPVSEQRGFLLRPNP